MNSTVTIYTPKTTPWKLKAEQLFQLDNIETYLAQFTELNGEAIIVDYQYIKFGLTMSLKVNLGETYTDPRKQFGAVYLRIRNNDMDTGKYMYYYVQGTKWLSQNCVELSLLCDVLNSFKGLYSFKDTTMILREHKDRFMEYTYQNLITGSVPISEQKENQYYRLGTVSVAKFALPFTAGTVRLIEYYYPFPYLQQKRVYNVTALGVYFDGEDYLVSVKYKIGNTTTTIYLTNEQLQTGCFYIITSLYGNLEDIFYVLTINGRIEDVKGYCNKIDSITENINPILLRQEEQHTILETNLQYVKWYLMYKTVGDLDTNTAVDCYLLPNIDGIYDFGGTYTGIKGLESVDKTDAKIIKIIALPYFPLKPSTNAFLSDFTLVADGDYNWLKLKTLDTKFANTEIPFDYQNIKESCLQEISADRTTALSGINTTTLRTLNDPKLYHSEFYIPKFIYDSFTLPIMCENVNIPLLASEIQVGTYNNNICFYTTSSMNARFAFEIPSYKETYCENDYPKFLVTARNNDVVLYNSPYLNYIRTGYNYDVKNKNISTAMTWVNAGASVLGTVATTGVAIASGGLAIPMAIGMATSTALTIANAINTTTQNERNLDQRLVQLRNQSATVIGSDDLDMLERYNGNKLLYSVYKPRVEIVELLEKLFHYTGYATNKMGIPNVTSRLHFNFLRCEPVLDYASQYFITKEFTDELEKIMRTGFTVLHAVAGAYDFEQKYENIELSIYNDLNS